MALKTKTLVVTLQPAQLDWVKKAAKEQKTKVSEFVRAMVDYLKDYEPKDITAKLAKSKLEAEIETIRQKADDAAKAAEKFTAQREKLERQLVEV